MDYASEETKAIGEKLIEKELLKIPNEKVRKIATEHIADIANNNKRDFRFWWTVILERGAHMSNNLNAGYRSDWLHKMASVCEASSTIDSTLFSITKYVFSLIRLFLLNPD